MARFLGKVCYQLKKYIYIYIYTLNSQGTLAAKFLEAKGVRALNVPSGLLPSFDPVTNIFYFGIFNRVFSAPY